jgi:cell division septation protein DedD
LAETASASNPVNEEQNRVVSNEITKHYLVGGGFKSEENVEKFILQLKERGIEGFSLGKKGSLFLVGIGSYDTETDAQNVLNETQKKYPEWNLWIYKK